MREIATTPVSLLLVEARLTHFCFHLAERWTVNKIKENKILRYETSISGLWKFQDRWFRNWAS